MVAGMVSKMTLALIAVQVGTTMSAAANVGNSRFGMGDLSDAMGTPVRKDADNQVASDAAWDQFFEPLKRGTAFRQERPENADAGHGDGFEAFDVDLGCGEHGCSQPVSLVTVVSGRGERSETTDRTTSLTRSPSVPGGALWTLQQAPNSCSLSWFNASWPLVSSYEVQPQAYGIESCVNSPGTVWFGMFQFEDSSAVDVLFEHICAGNLDLHWTLLGDHVERIAPSQALNAATSTYHQSLAPPRLELGPTSTSSPQVAARNRLEASGTVFMVVRNGCSGPATIEVKQTLLARMELSLASTFDLLDAVIVALVIGAAAMFVYSAILLCQAMKTLDDLEEALDGSTDEGSSDGDEIDKPHCALIVRSSSADEPLLKKVQK